MIALLPPGIVLSIDTAGDACAAAIVDTTTGRVLAAQAPHIGKGHAERLMAVLEAVLAEAGIGYRDLSGIGVSVGPGSFTGIRVGVSAARGLGLALDRPVVGVTSLAATAASVSVEDGELLVVRQAGRGAVYCLSSRDPMPFMLAETALAERFGAGGSLRLAGSGAEFAARALPERETRVVSAVDDVSPQIVAMLAATGKGVPPSPLYLREADAKPQARPLILASVQAS